MNQNKWMYSFKVRQGAGIYTAQVCLGGSASHMQGGGARWYEGLHMYFPRGE
jgi:hypothetical protein